MFIHIICCIKFQSNFDHKMRPSGCPTRRQAALPSVERLKLTIETCSNCHFPGHKAKQCPMPAERTSEKQKKEDDGKDGKEAKGARASKRVCPICEASSHPRICCPKLSAEQRAEYLARIEDFRKLQEAFQEATPVQEPPKVKEIKEATAAHVLVAAYRNIEVAVRDRMREIMTRMGLERLVVFSAAEEAAEAKAAADRTKAAGRAEKAQQAAQAAAKKAAERKAQKAEAVAKALAAKTAKVEAAAKALAAKTAKAEAEAKRRAEAKPKAKKESVPAPPAARGKRGNQETGPGKFTSKTGTVEVVRYITDGPARGWMVKGRAYTSSTQYFVKRPEAQLWETRYQALKGYNQTDPICTAVEKLRVEISEELAQPAKAKASASSSVSEDTPRRSEDSGSRKRLRLVSNSRPAPPESEEPKASAPAPPASAPAEPEEPEPKRRVLRLKVSSSSEEGRASPPKVSPPRREPPQQEPPKPPSKAQAKKEESPRPSQASPKSSPKAKAKAASAKAKPSQAASPKGSIPVRKELKRRASSSVETIRTLD
ncbi:unnamed protein product [Durusdinium trenchii]|uniref:CCHC-type domain-containing protein n=1 Tax=Durusdinium trenchii TaxID=1381693 RepID=A0ABP0S2S2_9DINO